jgi:hypothetical protein
VRFPVTPRLGVRARQTRTFYSKRIQAPLPFVFRWCTDYREDDDKLTDSIYHYSARIVLREPHRIVRIITVPGRDQNRNTDVEIITLHPPNRWRLHKFSVTDDVVGNYRLTRVEPNLTSLEIRFRTWWKVRASPDRARYRILFNRVWDLYVRLMEQEFRDSQAPATRRDLPLMPRERSIG